MPPLFGPLVPFSDTPPLPLGYGTPPYGTLGGGSPAAPIYPGAPTTEQIASGEAQPFQRPGTLGKQPPRFVGPRRKEGEPEPVLAGPPVQSGADTGGADRYFGPFNRITLGGAASGKL